MNFGLLGMFFLGILIMIYIYDQVTTFPNHAVFALFPVAILKYPV